jgi:hypothetical protein
MKEKEARAKQVSSRWTFFGTKVRNNEEIIVFRNEKS